MTARPISGNRKSKPPVDASTAVVLAVGVGVGVEVEGVVGVGVGVGVGVVVTLHAATSADVVPLRPRSLPSGAVIVIVRLPVTSVGTSFWKQSETWVVSLARCLVMV